MYNVVRNSTNLTIFTAIKFVVPVADLGGDPGVQWNPPFGGVLRNYEGFVVVLPALPPNWRSCNCVRDARARHKPIRSTRAHSLHKSASYGRD